MHNNLIRPLDRVIMRHCCQWSNVNMTSHWTYIVYICDAIQDDRNDIIPTGQGVEYTHRFSAFRMGRLKLQREYGVPIAARVRYETTPASCGTSTA